MWWERTLYREDLHSTWKVYAIQGRHILYMVGEHCRMKIINCTRTIYPVRRRCIFYKVYNTQERGILYKWYSYSAREVSIVQGWCKLYKGGEHCKKEVYNVQGMGKSCMGMNTVQVYIVKGMGKAYMGNEHCTRDVYTQHLRCTLYRGGVTCTRECTLHKGGVHTVRGGS